jgi:hypothetical protein
MLVLVGFEAWPHEATTPASASAASGIIMDWLTQASRFAFALPWRWIGLGVAVGFVVGVVANLLKRPAQPTTCQYQWTHDMADSQVNQIARYVELEKPFSYDHRLTDPIPSIGFKFPIRNHSLFDISIDENVKGEIYYDGTELAEPKIVRYCSADISHREQGGISIEQRLTPTEANHISKMKGTFHFSALNIMIKGGTQFPQVVPQRLAITEHQHALLMRDEAPPESKELVQSEDKRLHELAQRDRANLSNAVFVHHCEIQYELSEAVPYIDFRFHFFNGAVYEVSVPASIDGYIKFRKARLMGKVVIARNDNATNVGHASGGYFFVRLQLSREETDLIRNADNSNSDYFYFDQLQVQITATNMEPQSLKLPHAVPSDNGRAARPRDDATKVKEEVKSLEAELAKPTGLAFKVDADFQSNARLRAHKNTGVVFSNAQAPIEIDMYTLTAQFKVRFENHDVHRRALNRIELSLIEAQNETEQAIPFLEAPLMLLIDKENNNDLLEYTKFDFEDQRVVTVWLHFHAKIPREYGEGLNENYFLRLTLHALGQQPASENFNVDWEKALKNATYITSRSL